VFDHVTIRVSDQEASTRFYDTVLATFGLERRSSELGVEWGDFSISPASDEHPVTRRLHVAFFAPTLEEVHEFWRAGTEAGYRDDGRPGPRPQYSESYYGSFLLDPDGNSAEAVYHDASRERGSIDHLWIRVADVAGSKVFYETVTPYGGFHLAADEPDRAQFVGAGGSFSVVRGKPTEHLHMAFPAQENAVVEEFHRAAIAAGYESNGSPGERPVYHKGYYGAFVLDPDGNNVEVVNHNRD
jgi:catechol 2,3-dioxygenase-like lactoylglutathione lyase family enzyme